MYDWSGLSDNKESAGKHQWLIKQQPREVKWIIVEPFLGERGVAEGGFGGQKVRGDSGDSRRFSSD